MPLPTSAPALDQASCIRVREQSVLLDGRDKSVRQRLGGATWAASGKKSTRLRGFPFELHGLHGGRVVKNRYLVTVLIAALVNNLPHFLTRAAISTVTR